MKAPPRPAAVATSLPDGRGIASYLKVIRGKRPGDEETKFFRFALVSSARAKPLVIPSGADARQIGTNLF